MANEVVEFEKRCRGDAGPSISSHVLLLMVRGFFSSLHAPVGYYPSTGVTSNQLYPCIYEAILFLETAGFNVCALISDGASPDRKFYHYHADDTSDGITYCTPNPFDPTCRIYFICDVPHLPTSSKLLATTRRTPATIIRRNICIRKNDYFHYFFILL